MPYWRLSGYYFFYFGALGVLVPFWGPYLQARGIPAAGIGALMAILMGTKIVAPMLWGWLADRRGERMPLVRLASLLTVLSFVGIYWAEGFVALGAVTLLFGFFWNAALPQFEAVTFNHLGLRANRYASVRVWGSVGFVLGVAALGLGIDRLGTGLVPNVALALFVCVWLSALLVPDRGQLARDPTVSVAQQLRRREIRAFLWCCLLMQFSHGAYYAFYSLHLEEAGYGNAAVGALWSLGVIVEVLVFVRMHWLLERFGARLVLLTSLALAAIRWCLTGLFVESLAVQVLAQTLHAATFGTFHATAIHLTHQYFPGATQGRGQALYNSVSFGAGGAGGSLLAGLLWGEAGAAWSFLIAAAAAALGWLVALAAVDRARRY